MNDLQPVYSRKGGGRLSAAELVDSIRALNPDRRFAIHKGAHGDVSAIAIDRPEGGWDMFAAAYIDGTWVQCILPSIQERNEWDEVFEPCLRCGQTDTGQTGEYPCTLCGLPTTHDDVAVRMWTVGGAGRNSDKSC